MNSRFSKKLSAFSLIELSLVILVVAILIAGVMQGRSLLKKSQINSAKAITQSSAVSSIKDLTLWIEPVMDNSFTNAAGSYVVQDGDAVSSWNDFNQQLVLKKNLTQSTSSKKPTYKEDGINGLPSLYFDGTDYLETTLTAISKGLNSYTMFIVWKQFNNSTTQVMFHQRGPSTGCNGDFAGVYVSTDGYINGWACGFGDTQAFTYRANTPYTTTYRVDNSVTNNVTMYTNGTKYGPVQKSGINVKADAMAVGYGGVDDNFYFIGMISEVIVYNRALKDEEVTAVRDYLTKKYGFTA